MSTDKQTRPRDLFDVVCALDDLADWLSHAYPDHADRLSALSQELKGCIELRLVDRSTCHNSPPSGGVSET
jgi:hypothetical protein